MVAVLTDHAVSGYQRWEPPQVGNDPSPAAAAVEPVVHPTVSELEDLEHQAREEGRAAGFAQGLAEAREQGRAQLARLEAICAQAAHPLDALDTEVEQELAQLALAIARRVIAQELATQPQHIITAVRQAAAALPAATRKLRVQLHPDDVALLRELDAAEADWQLVADPAIQRGGCVLESERSRLDARVETRLAAMIDAVLGDEGEV